MELKFVEEENLINYKVPSMTIGFAYCDFKCEKENHSHCQNRGLAQQPNITITNLTSIVDLYINNSITSAIVFGGLEPLVNAKSRNEVLDLIKHFREKTNDDIVIYTGYNKEEIDKEFLSQLEKIGKINIIIKYGRFIENDTPHLDKILNIELASNNQYAERIC